MNTLFRRITSSLTALILIGTNFVPAAVYAASEITENKDDEDVIFSASINDNSSYTANVDEQLSLNVNLSVVGDGYIQGGTIKIENNNYKIGDIEENNDVEKIDDNTFEIGQINNDESIKFSIPIEFEKSELMDTDYFEKESNINLNATYINENGKEENISKIISNNLKWDKEVEGNISQELKRYLKYENKTLISFVISSGLKDNIMPITEKTIQILAPLVNNAEPSKIIVSGDDVSYKYQDQVLLINKNYVSDNKVAWDSSDEYIVTYIYDTQADEMDIETLAVMSAKTASGNTLEKRTENFSYHVKDEIGNLLETSIDGDNEVNKGYMYTNLNKQDGKLETQYKSNYKVNIGIIDYIDEIEIREFPSNYESIDKKITIDRDNLIEILGEEGTIKVLDQKNIELGVLNKDNLQLDVNQFGLKFYTSKPVKEGTLNLEIDKAINPDLNYTKETLSNATSIENKIEVFGKLQGEQISYNCIVKNIGLIEPQSNATITISKDNLSTVVTNENVVITATLKKNDITDALYTDPEILITLPNQISNVILKDARLVYEDELIPVDFKMVGKQIYLKLQGTQTEYSNIPTADGTVVRIVADLELDNLAVNSDEKVTMQYTNVARNELKSTEADVKIIAPTGFITSNEGTLSKTVSAITEDEVVEIPANDKEKQIKIGGKIVSNFKENVQGLSILGRIPSQESSKTDASEENLNSTFTTTMLTTINVEGIDADIYYSDNGNATYDLNNSENGWSLEAKDSSKSYLIIPKSEVMPAQKIVFSYNAKIPQNLNYENKAYSQYSIYYNNGAKDGIEKNSISSKILSIETERLPIIKTEITASDFYLNDEIKNGDNIYYGEYIKYIVKATNTGRKTAQNVTLTVEKPEDSQFYVEEEIENEDVYDNYFIYEPTLTKTIEKIDPGETVEATYVIRVSAQEGKSVTLRTEIKADNMLENSTASFENKMTDGTIEMRIFTFQKNESVRIGDEIEYKLSVNPYKINEFKNVTINIDIPKYIDIVNCEGGNYNEKTRVLSYYIESLEQYKTYTFTAKVMNSEEPSQEISLIAKATYDNAEKEIKSNTVSNTILDLKGFSATFSSNIKEKMLDTDTVEYYINVKNESKKPALINIFNKLPSELKLISYTVKNGENTYTRENGILNTTIYEKVEAGENIKVTIVAKPYILDSINQVKQIENNVSIKVNDLDLQVDKITQQIEGTSNYNTVVSSENQVETENIYSISGKVWYDKNGNSAQDENETKISSILLKLYDVNKQDYLKDEKGNDISVSTNDNGEYKFDNLYSGQYIVIANYDNKIYKIANYQAGELSSNEDNDFIETNKINVDKINASKINENIDTAASNVIELNGENIYNIDLGLMDIENFKITLNNKISKITVINGDNTETYEYDDFTANLKVDNKKIDNTVLVIEYLIEVKNEGNVDGYVTEVASKIQKGLSFVSELNQDWYINEDNEAINSSISDKLLKSGETEKLKLVLIKNENKKVGEVITNSSEIRGTYNQYGIEEIAKTKLEANKAKSAQIYLTESSTKYILQTLGISVSIIIVTFIIAFGCYKLLEVKLKKYN